MYKMHWKSEKGLPFPVLFILCTITWLQAPGAAPHSTTIWPGFSILTLSSISISLKALLALKNQAHNFKNTFFQADVAFFSYCPGSTALKYFTFALLRPYVPEVQFLSFFDIRIIQLSRQPLLWAFTFSFQITRDSFT